MGDLIRLSQVISNLLGNAAKYSTRPGRIRVALTEGDGEALVAVEDEGDGIPRIFDLFVQGDRTLARSQGGLGIGLTLVRPRRRPCLLSRSELQRAPCKACRSRGAA